MNWVAVAGAGMLGVLVRVGLWRWFVPDVEVASASWPWVTFSINLIGSFVIGVVYAVMAASEWRLAVVGGFLGGFTTFSAFSWEAMRLFEQQQTMLAFGYMCASPILGVACCFAGARLFA